MRLNKKLLSLSIFVLLVGGYFALDLKQYLSFEFVQSQQTALQSYVASHFWLSVGIYFAGYVLITGLSIPGAAILTLLGGALFGVIQGSIIISFASTIGACFAFLIARYVARNAIETRFSNTINAINRGVAQDGIYYLLSLRLIPIFPFFVVNLVMGLTQMPLKRYYWVSQLGMLPATIIYVNAGTQLASLTSTADILSAPLLISLALLGIFPWITKAAMKWLQTYRIYRNYEKPRSFDRNLIVIGAGAGGLVTSYIAAAVKAKVTLIEKHKMGGDCLNTGCVPSKALISTGRFLADVNNANQYGVHHAKAEFDFKEVMNRVNTIIRRIEPHDSAERYEKLGVECLHGEAKVVSPWEVEINGQRLSAPNIVIATGAHPRMPEIPGIDSVQPLTSNSLWELDNLPKHLLIIGGGAIACELGQCFTRLGSEVTMIVRGSQILSREDTDAAELVAQRLLNEGMNIRFNCTPQSFSTSGEEQILHVIQDNQEKPIPFDRVLIATGRVANIQGMGLEALGIDTSEDLLSVNRHLQTRCPSILACGDVAGPHQFTHAAGYQAWYAAVNALFGPFKKFAVDHRFIPFTTYTSPEVARIGLNEKEAKAKGVRYEVVRYDLNDLDRAITDSADYGFVKVLTPPGKDRILGVTLVGKNACDMLAEFSLAMRHGLGLTKILATTHAYPTYAEANKFVAGEWKRKNAPKKVLTWLERYHQWRRGPSE